MGEHERTKLEAYQTLKTWFPNAWPPKLYAKNPCLALGEPAPTLVLAR